MATKKPNPFAKGAKPAFGKAAAPFPPKGGDKAGGKMPKFARGGGIESKGKTRGKVC